MLRTITIALRVTLLTALVLGLGYPLAVTGLAQLLFPRQADGSILNDERGRPVGSDLIGQAFTRPHYLHPRPSAAGDGWDGTKSGGANLGPTAKPLADRVRAETARLTALNPNAPGPVPPDLVTMSASGLDPHLSPAAALWQAPRIARARGVSEERVRAVIEAGVVTPFPTALGPAVVEVLSTNLALDRQFGRPR